MEKVITELSYAGRGFEQLPEKVAQRCGSTLVKLDLSENSLKSGAGLEGLTCLSELVLDKNGLKTIKTFPRMPSVTTLWLNNNSFADSEQIVSEIANKFPNLTYLSMLFNPCVPNLFMEEAAATGYKRHRLYVISRLLKLQSLDSSNVSDEERAEAKRVGHLMTIAKPKAVAIKHKPVSEADDDKPPPPKHIISNDPPRVAAFLAKGKPRYDGTNSEGNRFIVNDDL